MGRWPQGSGMVSGAAVQVAAGVLRPAEEPVDEADQLLHGLLVGVLPLLERGRLGVPQDARLGIAAHPGDDRCRSCRE